LEVDLGLRHDAPGFVATADLLVNGIRYAAIGATPTPGNWSKFTATYVGLAADVGDPITIELSSTAAGFPPQADFDNVRLSDNIVSVVPEPGSLGVFGMGVIGLLVFARRKRASISEAT